MVTMLRDHPPHSASIFCNLPVAFHIPRFARAVSPEEFSITLARTVWTSSGKDMGIKSMDEPAHHWTATSRVRKHAVTLSRNIKDFAYFW